MKKTPIKKVGKYGKINIEANKKLRILYTDIGVDKCEVNLQGCLYTSFLGFAHRHRRYWYKSKPHLLYALEQTVLACVLCHNKLDNDKELLEKTFNRLRGKENV